MKHDTPRNNRPGPAGQEQARPARPPGATTMQSANFIPNPVLGAALAAGAMVLFAVCSLIIASAVRRLDTDTGTLIAALVNLPLGIVLVLGQIALFGPMQPPSLLGALGFLMAGAFSTYLGRWLFFKSIETAGPTRASSFQTSSPLITALLGWVLLDQYLSPLALTGIALGVVGLVTAGLGSRGARATAESQHTPIDMRTFVLIGLGSSTAYAISHILRAGAIQTWNEPVAGVALGVLTGTLVMFFVNRRQLPQVRRRGGVSGALGPFLQARAWAGDGDTRQFVPMP